MENLNRGAAHFNAGRFFEAHEDWEVRWRHLPMPDQPQVQAAILVCGAFVLIGKGRLGPAERLAKLSLERFAEAATAIRIHGNEPAMALPEAEERMLRVVARIRTGETDRDALLSEAKGLKAVVYGA